MTTRRFLEGLFVTVALCLSATVGWAQTTSVYVTGGGTSLRNSGSFLEAYIPFNWSYKSGVAGNVGVEVPLKKSKIFGLEGSYGFSQNQLRLTETDVSPNAVTSYGFRDSRFSGDLVVHSPSTYRGIRPYFAVGGEYDSYSPTNSATTSAKTSGFAKQYPAVVGTEGAGGVNFGGGLDLIGTRKLGIRLDVRDHITSTPNLGLPFGSSLTSKAYFPVSGSAHDIEYSIGIVYHFGREKPSPPETNSPKPRTSSRPSPSKGPSYPSPF
jgi:hypothetical protein